MGAAKWDLILLSYVEIRNNAERVIRALAPGGIVVAEYFHHDSAMHREGLPITNCCGCSKASASSVMRIPKP